MSVRAHPLHAALVSGAFLVCLLSTGCGGGGGGGGSSGGGVAPPPPAVANLVMPGLSLAVERLANPPAGTAAYSLTAADAGPVAGLEILSGADWETAVTATVSRQATGSWHASIPSGDQRLFIRATLTDGNIVESVIAGP